MNWQGSKPLRKWVFTKIRELSIISVGLSARKTQFNGCLYGPGVVKYKHTIFSGQKLRDKIGGNYIG
ncbi:hypothetical protein FTRO_0021940 [Fructobacillus tropaeoli]|uniref:Uncharacterized protein n=1 Tax=Fructobacillus tropaeoli TaxID=709323 RepID=A0A3F3HEM8_9LACO|nr:hypothetical protein FTRO_0021940 [Fructobacillus tropaeoli]